MYKNYRTNPPAIMILDPLVGVFVTTLLFTETVCMSMYVSRKQLVANNTYN